MNPAFKPPTVSVVIPCYNYEKYVGLAIDSVLAQRTPATEIIVVDDGSTDGSAAVIQARPGVRYIRQENAGHVAAFNRGYRESHCEVVLFLDADDVLEPGALEAVVRNWRPGAAKLQYELKVIDGAGDWTGRVFCNYPTGYDAGAVRAEFTAHGTYVWPVCTGNAYGRAFLEQVMPLTVKSAPDGLLNTVAPLYGDVVVVPEVLGRYRLHTQNQSYHGTDANRMDLRFARQIALRRSEFDALREHALRLGAVLPEGNLLDRELVFLNYRLMVLKLGGQYAQAEQDSVWSLWRKSVALLMGRPFKPAVRAARLAWATALAVAPRPLARALVQLRFNRAEVLKRFRRAPAPLSPA